MEYFQILLGLGAVLIGLLYYYSTTFAFWQNRGIIGPKPIAVVGNFLNVALRKMSLGDQIHEWYKQYKNETVFGLFEGNSPVLVINDLDLIKDVLIRDFSLFADRGFKIFPKIEVLGEHLFLLEPKRWRLMRNRLSPIFTSGKLREMFPLLEECAQNLEKYLDYVAESGKDVEVRDLTAKYTTDVIGSCAFGITMNALNDDNSEFRQMGRKMFKPTFRFYIRDTLKRMWPSLYEIFGPYLQNKEVDSFFVNLISETMKYRKEHNVSRPDFVNMLMEVKEHPEKMDNIEITDALLAAQAFVFFVAGFETSSTTMSHALYELAQNQDMQNKLREEITENFAKNNGISSYDQLKELKYLDKVFKETLRKYPVLGVLNRKAMENYTFKGTKITIPENQMVMIPVMGIHRDPAIYPDPDKFDPERFNEDAVAARHPMSYLPFGDGPRNCIGARFAQFQSKLGLAMILHKHKVEVCENTTIPYKSEPKSFLLQLKGGVHLRVAKV
ncbi:cytochrome P450 6a2-like [Ceratina calcarata]|uniref:Cytochrome P450 6a2-like n=1 Tax=Ceratina calcarata TaxID=156304 RepID=A0AAJ7JE92_9HYME|nr:cytochrome P450 6a2-like [Ceratina calcarata]